MSQRGLRPAGVQANTAQRMMGLWNALGELFENLDCFVSLPCQKEDASLLVALFEGRFAVQIPAPPTASPSETSIRPTGDGAGTTNGILRRATRWAIGIDMALSIQGTEVGRWPTGDGGPAVPSP